MNRIGLASFAFVAVAACSSSGVTSTEAAQKAYLGLDASVDKAITLGFAGFNAAKSANIDPQNANGAKSGTMTISGQVDQGASANKQMRLVEKLVQYSDDGNVSYATSDTSPPHLDMSLKSIPSGTLSGTLVGTYAMTGQLEGSVTLNLSFTSTLQPNAQDAKIVERKPGTTHITGTATAGDAVYTVDVTR
jgi:hypothetical protein